MLYRNDIIQETVVHKATIALLCLFGIPVAWGSDGHRQHDAHEHGVGLLTVVPEGKVVRIELEVPAVNVVGFEHAPTNNEERQTIKTKTHIFRRADGFFALSPKANCEKQSAQAALRGAQGEHHDDKDQHGHKDEHASEKQAAHHDDKHGHGHKDEHDEDKDASSHSSLVASYVYRCEAPRKLETIEVHLFEHLLDMRTLQAQVATATHQTQVRLSGKAHKIDLRR